MSDDRIAVEVDDFEVEADAYFGMVPEYVGDSSVSANAVRLFWVLNRYANQRGELKRGRRQLMERCKFGSLKTLDRAMDELEAIAAVLVVPRWNEAGTVRLPNLYRLRMVPPKIRRSEGSDTGGGTPTDDATGGRDTGDARGRDTGDHITTTERQPDRDDQSLFPPAAAKEPANNGKRGESDERDRPTARTLFGAYLDLKREQSGNLQFEEPPEYTGMITATLKNWLKRGIDAPEVEAVLRDYARGGGHPSQLPQILRRRRLTAGENGAAGDSAVVRPVQPTGEVAV